MATTGLALSYLALIAFVGWVVAAYVSTGRSGPTIVLRESPGALAALQRRIVDEVKTGVMASERAHQLQGQGLTVGPFNRKTWRSTGGGGYITLVMKVLPDKPVVLNCTYWGSEEGPRKFDIIVAGRVIATQVLDYNVPGHFFDVEYKIPEDLTRGETEVAIEFRGYPGAVAGAFFGIHILKR